YVTVDSQPRALAGKAPPAPRQVFKGWMYASSPGLHPLEHPVYDAWLITCRATAPVTPPPAAPAPVAPPAAPKPTPTAKPAADRQAAAGGGRPPALAAGALKRRIAFQRGRQAAVIFVARDLLRPELGEMIGQELGVEQLEAAGDQAGDQMDQGDLRGVGAPR